MPDLDEIAQTLESLPRVLESLLRPIDPAALRVRPAAGEWCVLEVIGHLITTDRPAFEGRIAAIVGGATAFEGFDPAVAMGGRDFTAASLDDLLEELAEVRGRSVAFVRSLDPATLDRTAQYKKYGTFAALDFVLEWPFHDQDHIQQILDCCKLAYLPGMTDTMRAALGQQASVPPT